MTSISNNMTYADVVNRLGFFYNYFITRLSLLTMPLKQWSMAVCLCWIVHCVKHRIGGVIVSVLTSNAVDRGFEPRSGQTKG